MRLSALKRNLFKLEVTATEDMNHCLELDGHKMDFGNETCFVGKKLPDDSLHVITSDGYKHVINTQKNQGISVSTISFENVLN